MKYFEKFLADNESGYDDIDISVHCDVEIFEWLMNYIHNKVIDESHTVINLVGSGSGSNSNSNSPNKATILHIDKTILISILISSEFLQMDSLVVYKWTLPIRSPDLMDFLFIYFHSTLQYVLHNIFNDSSNINIIY